MIFGDKSVFVYENRNDMVNVYKLMPMKEKIKEYRKMEIEKIPVEDRVWMA